MDFSNIDISQLAEVLSPAELAELDGLLAKTGKELVEAGWEKFWSELFGEDFVERLAPHHVEAITWHWKARLDFLEGRHPDYLAYFPIWPRGQGKSSLAERMVVVDAGLSVVYGQPGFCLFVSRNKDKVKDHIGNIETLLASPPVKKYFPALSQTKRREESNQKRQWTASLLHTEGNYIIKGGTLDSGLAGSRVGETRITLIVPDDIDGREDSVVIAEARFRQLTTEIIPMRQQNTLIFFAQNLISRHSVMYRIQSGQSRALTNRKPTEPIPAVIDLKTEVRTVDGIVKDVYVSGTPTWDYWDRQRIQDEIDSEGLAAFLSESQHEVGLNSEMRVLQNWNDDVHVISYSEFEAVYGTSRIPKHWTKDIFNDWARTKTQYHANVAGILTTAAQNSHLPGVMFLFHPMSFPANTAPEDVALRILHHISPRVQVQGKMKTWEDVFKDAIGRVNLDKYLTNTSELIEQRRKVIASIMPPIVRTVIRAQGYKTMRGSHEQGKTGALEVYRRVFGLDFTPTNPGADGGVDMLNIVQKVDENEPHPFRSGLMGRSNYYVVVEDDPADPGYVKNGVLVRKPIPKSSVLSPIELHDAQLLRYQFENCRYREANLTVAGERDDAAILKLSDDYVNGHMMLLYDRTLRNTPLRSPEMADAILMEVAPQLAMDAILEDKARWVPGAVAARNRAMRRIKEELQAPRFTSPFQRAEHERNN